MNPSPPRITLNVITCSTRPLRTGPVVTDWLLTQAAKHALFELVHSDLKVLALPMLDEPEHPRLRKYQNDHTKAWSTTVDAADAFVFVMPEYNYGPPASLLNALSYLAAEWAYKPVAFVSYGGMSGGIPAVQVAKQLVTTLRLVPLLEAVAIQNVAQHIKDNRYQSTHVVDEAAGMMFSELHRWALALRTLRTH